MKGIYSFYLSGKNKPEDLLQSQNEMEDVMAAEEKNRSSLSSEDKTKISSEDEKKKNSEEKPSLFSEFVQRSIQGSLDGDYYPIDEHYFRIRG